METAYLHIVTNHIPIIGVPLAIALLVLGIWRKSDDLKTASFLIFVFLGLATLATFLLGQGGEDFVEEVAGVSEAAIHDHEDFAKFALASVAITAIVSLFAILRYQGLSFFRRKITNNSRLIEGEVSAVTGSYFPTWLTFAVLLLAVLSGGILGYTGKLGGKIRHTEFYGNAPTGEEEEKGQKRRGKNEKTTDAESQTSVNPTTEKQIPPAEEKITEETEEADTGGKGRNRRGRRK